MLWLPIGIHFTWNFVQGFVLGLPVSGLVAPVSVVKAKVAGKAWLTGASYGPEGGLLTTLVIVAATGYLALSKSIYISKETRTLVFGSPTRPGPVETILLLKDTAK